MDGRGLSAKPVGRRGAFGALLSLLAWPTVLLGIFFVVPFGLMVRVSLAPHDETGLWLPGFTLEPYRELAQPMLTTSLMYTVQLALIVASLSVVIGFPLTYLITLMRRRAQTFWLIFLLSTLALSEVIVTFSWQVMLSKRIGLPDLFVLLGIIQPGGSLWPSLGAVISCLLYVVLPFVVLTLYPGLSRLDVQIVEAARMAGASSLRAFFTIVVPLMSGPIVTAFLLATIISLGSYVVPIVLGHPQNWTLAILISKTALSARDLPFASAMAMLLLAATVLLVGLIGLYGRRRQAA